MGDITFKEFIKSINSYIERFEKIEGRQWGIEGSMIELQKQAGELSKQIMAYEKYYYPDRAKTNKYYESTKEKIADELVDILFCIVRIAKHYNIDLEKANMDARKRDDKFFSSYEFMKK